MCLTAIGLASVAAAEDPAKVLPDDPRIESIKSPEAYFGFALGSRHLRHDQVVSYWRYLSEASERVTLIPYGKTHGQRPLLVAAFTSDANGKKLEDIRRRRRLLTSGKYSGDLAQELLVMYLGYSVHGDESSAMNAAPLVAYHLASSNSEQVKNWLETGVFLIDPALNPDGVDRFANWANENRGRYPSASSTDREHVQPWPGGRTNYYWFDLNRDWLPLTHPESQGRLRLFHSWKPNVVLDFHEMSGDSSFFFQPGIPARNNPLSSARNVELTGRFSIEHARSMDAANELFFTEERFDDFYVGKGSTYPDLHGAVGILFEQGSTRGLRLKNDRSDRHFRDTVANQVRTSLSSLRIANQLRGDLLKFQIEFYETALHAGRASPTTGYLLTGSRSRIDAAAGLLKSHAIEVYQASSEIRFDGATYPPSQSIVIPSAQAESTFVQSLMDPLQSFKENIFYDVSSWHLPSAFDLNMHVLQSDIPGEWLAVRWSPARPGTSDLAESGEVAAFAWSPLELGAPRVAAALHRANANLRVTTKPMVTTTKQGSIEWPLGTFLLLKQANAKHWDRVVRTLSEVSRANSVDVAPIESSMTPTGPDLGSDTTLDIPKCRPLLVVGSGTQSSSAGALWHHFDVRMGQACTLVDADRLSTVELHEYSCVILPDGNYSLWTKNDAEHLQQYAKSGGTVIAVASAIRYLSAQKLIELGSTDKDATLDLKDQTRQVRFGEAAEARALETIAGAFLLCEVDSTHPLAYGFPDAQVPVFRDHTIWFPAAANSFKIAAQYKSVVAGYVSDSHRRRLASTAAAWVEPVGSGRFILLADNPVFRGYVRSGERFLTNAVLLGPALRIPSAAAQAGDVEEHDH